MRGSDIKVRRHNAVYYKIECDQGIAYELSERFTFRAQNYRFHPLFKNKVWDGRIRLFSPRSRLLYCGLLDHVKTYCKDNDYSIDTGDLDLTDEFSVQEARDFIKKLKHPEKIKERAYQVESFVHCVRNKRSLFISPTASGKSLIIYWLVRYFRKRTLIVVDSINLLNQMVADFAEYGFDASRYVHLIQGGSDKNTLKPIVISTWQSASKMPKDWFNQFEMVIGDEAHRYKATSLKKIMENLTKCYYRFGFTGSLDGAQVNELTLESLFGKKEQIKTTKELIDEGFLSDLKIKAIVLKYPEEVRKSHTKDSYDDEISFLYSNQKRNKFIENLALSLEGNTLLLFQRVDSHGIPLFNSLKQRADNTPVYYVSGMVEGEDRENIRKIVNTHDKSITVASVGTFSTGVNIPRIHNIIVAAPTKSVVRILQTIGRGLRKSDDKYQCVVFDIADNLSWKKHQNYTLVHFSERIKLYMKEQFDYQLYQVELKQ